MLEDATLFLPESSVKAWELAALITDCSCAELRSGKGKGKAERDRDKERQAQSTAQAKLPRAPGFSGTK